MLKSCFWCGLNGQCAAESGHAVVQFPQTKRTQYVWTQNNKRWAREKR